MYCQTVIKRRNAFRDFVGPTTETRRSDDGAVRSKKRLPKWQKGKFTKHYFEGTSRIVSKLGEGTFHQPTGLTAGGIDYIKQSAKVQEAIDSYIRGLNVPPGPPTQHGIYGTPDFTGQEYPSIDWSDISQDQEPPEGWPRPPKFNEPGDVPGPPVQYGDPVKPDNVKGGFGYVDNGIEEKNLYYYHPDHLGSSSYITDKDGNISQHTEYMAFGEVLFDEHKVSRRMPYLFNGKELDSETGLYYYGARYYDPRVSIFLNVDPLAEKYPFTSPYTYTNNNPIMLIDPTGMEPIGPVPKPKIIYRKDWGAKPPILGGGRQYEYITATIKAQTFFGVTYDKPVAIPADLKKYYNTITIHHSGNKDNYLTIQELQQKEQAGGYADIPYHFAIDNKGNIYEGRPINVKGAHVKGANTGNIGIVLMSDLDTENSGLSFFESALETYNGNGGASYKMRTSLTSLISYLKDEYSINYLEGHKEKAKDPRNCPGDGGMKMVEYLRKKLNMKTRKNEE
ncbi:N-acetylmuramoyl-L-alanine amidase [Riemerella anatipestifer]|nr:N-acetylmuramoyl-L-alanine amidase [Riemerella anatipestifer]